MDGVATASNPAPFRAFASDLSMIVPPFTLWGAWKRGPIALAMNILTGVALAAFAWSMIELTDKPSTPHKDALPQWTAVSFGYYAVFSWASTLRAKDPATFKLIWGTPAFICTTLGYGLVSLAAYALAFWSAPYAETVLKLPKAELAFILGANGALKRIYWRYHRRTHCRRASRQKSGRSHTWWLSLGVVAPVIPIWIGFTTENWYAVLCHAVYGRNVRCRCARCSSSHHARPRAATDAWNRNGSLLPWVLRWSACRSGLIWSGRFRT